MLLVELRLREEDLATVWALVACLASPRPEGRVALFAPHNAIHSGSAMLNALLKLICQRVLDGFPEAQAVAIVRQRCDVWGLTLGEQVPCMCMCTDSVDSPVPPVKV